MRRYRKLLVSGALVIGLLAATVLTVQAGSIYLDGGAGCSGAGYTSASNGAAHATTDGCSGSNRYIDVSIYTDGDEERDGYCGPTWAFANLICGWGIPTGVLSIWADHNLCYAWCNGYVETYDYW